MEKMKKLSSGIKALMSVLAIGIFLVSCQDENREQQAVEDLRLENEAEQSEETTYRGEITAVNEAANKDRRVSGNVELIVQEEQLQINIEVTGLEPGMMYLQHLHGSKEGDAISCPDSAGDTNNDGVVDITEAYDIAGVTMIPLHDDPSSFEIDTETYPTANEDGTFSYRQTVDLSELEDAFTEKFDWEGLDFDRFSYLIHGVEEDAVPESAESVKGLPAHVTLPVGCAKISE